MPAEALVGLKDYAAAMAEYEAAVTLKADDAELGPACSPAAEAAGKADDVAKRAAKTLKQLDPEHARTRSL